MSMRIGDIDVANEIIDLRLQLIRTQMILELVVNKNASKIDVPTPEEMKILETNAVNALIAKYPNMLSRK